MCAKLDDETSYRLLKALDENPDISQRQLAEELGISLGKANYCIKALIDVGHIKFISFVRSKNKSNYAYVLTPAGLKEKVHVTARFLKAKQVQYDDLRKEIAKLEEEVKHL